MKNRIIKQIHTFDRQMIKELAEISTDYTCKDQNKELENQSKKIVLRAREFSQWLKKEPINQVMEAWLREQNQ